MASLAALATSRSPPDRVREFDRSVNAEVGRFAALRERAFRRFWLGSFASVGATQLLIMGQGWLVYRLSGSALDLGLVGAAAAVPSIALSLFGGVLADRFDKRRLLIATSICAATLLALLAGLDASGRVEVWHVLTIVALISCVTGLDWPVRQAIYPALVSRSAMMSAVVLNSFIWQAMRMAMPALGGILIAVFDTWVIFALGACGFLAMAATLTTIALRPHRTATRAGVAELLHGVGYVFRQRAFFTLIPLTYALMFLGTSYLNLMPLFADAIDTSEWGYGLLISAAGVGSVIGTLWIGRYQRSPRLGWWMLAGLVGSCASLFAFVAALAAYAVGWLTSSIALGLALTFNFSMALASSIFLVMSMTTLQLLVPDQLRGRVMSIHGITFSLIPLGALLGGALAQWWNAPGALLIHAGLLTLVVVLVFGSQRWLRQLDGLALAPGHDGSARGTHG